jgi:hypothetical protein
VHRSESEDRQAGGRPGSSPSLRRSRWLLGGRYRPHCPA